MSKIIGTVEIELHRPRHSSAKWEIRSPQYCGHGDPQKRRHRKGQIVDFRKAASAVHAALEEAENVGHHC